MRLSNHFTLKEFCRSNTATRMGRTIEPEDDIIENLRFLCVEVLEPIRELVDCPVIVTSGYRPEWLNKKIGGSKTSQHMQGLAADFVLSAHTDMSLLEACQAIVQANNPVIEYDQLIYEFGEWIHVSAAREEPRQQVLSALKERNAVSKLTTVYKQGLHDGIT